MNRALLVSATGMVLMLAGCSDEGQGTATSTTSTPASKPAQPADYAGDQPGSFFFSTPNSDFGCAILATPSAEAGCQGTLPDSAPKVPGAGAPDVLVKPNTVSVTGTEPGRFLSSGNPAYRRIDGPAKVLPYGVALAANGFTCSVDEKTGITCQSEAGHGFTVSTNALRVW